MKYGNMEFINDSKLIHNNKYDYSLVNYINKITKVKIVCSIHGIFEQTPSHHLNKRGCKKCSINKKKLSNREFIERSKKVHNNEFDYSLVKYVNSYTKVKIICNIHGIFEQKPNSHLNGQKCKKCIIDNQTLTCEEFIEISNKIHNNKYEYSLVRYLNNLSNVEIICPIHGIFNQRPSNHMNGSGCKKCAIDNTKSMDYLQKCSLKFENKYDYSMVNYINSKEKVKIICPNHGQFEQNLKDHFSGNGCPFCSGKKMNTNLFIEKSTNNHNNYYDYSLVDYKRAFDKVKILCPLHGMFEQLSYIHLAGSGCPICKSSKGEIKISSLLDEININYIPEYTFEKCIHKLKLPFDFYLPDYNMCIEYNGIQHYKPIEYFGGEEDFKIRKIRDEIKKEFCKNNNMIYKFTKNKMKKY